MAYNKTDGRKIRHIIGIIVPIFIILAIVFVIIFSIMKKTGDRGNLTSSLNLMDTEDFESLAFTDAKDFDKTLVAESDDYELYLTGSNLSITVRNKKTGAVLESTVDEDDGKNNAQWLGFMKSGVALNVINGLNDAEMADLINNENIIRIATVDNGFYAKVTFTDLGFSLGILVRLTDDSLVVEIPDKSIGETKDGLYIGAINLFPFLGYSYLDEKPGYMLIPDGNGALIYLNNKEGRLTGGYSQMIYGEDTGFKDTSTPSLFWDEYQTVNEEKNILAPVFGMVHTEDGIGFLGIVEKGAERASIEAYPNGVTMDYNRIYPKFILRKLYVQPTSNSNVGTITMAEQDRTHMDIRVKYCFVSGDDADYAGLAVRFRRYLMEEAGLSAREDGYKTRIDFLGSEREEWLVFKKTVPMTSVEQIREIYNRLKEEGLNDILTVYKGWQKGGLYNLPVTKYKADKSVGGTKELTRLIKECEKGGIDFYLYHDALRINPEENNTAFNVVKRVDKRLYEEPTYMYVYDRFLFLTPRRSNYYLNTLSKDLSRAGISKLALAGITNHIYSYSYSGEYYSRPSTYEDYRTMISNLHEKLELTMEQPFCYLWKYTDSFLDMPVGTSDFIFEDEKVPFLAIALKGILPMYSEYINFEANKKEFFLNLVEMGIRPSFYITYEDSSDLIYTNSSDIYSSKFSNYKEEIIRYSNELSKVFQAVEGAFITDHERLDNGVTVVSYDNGVKVYINYSDTRQTVDGITIEAMSYKVGEAK